MRTIVSMAAALILVSAAAGEAQTARTLGTLGGPGIAGVLRVMEEARCPRPWLSEVLQESGVNPFSLERVRAGQPIVAKSPTCEGLAPASVHVASLAILALYEERSELRALEAARNRPAPASQAPTQELESLEAEVRGLQGKLAELDKSRPQAPAPQPEPPPQAPAESTGYSIWNLLLAGLAGVAVMGAVAFFIASRRERGFAKRPPDSIPAKDREGETYTAYRKSIVEDPSGSGEIKGLYICPRKCGADDIPPEEMEEHLNDECSQKKLYKVTRPPDPGTNK